MPYIRPTDGTASAVAWLDDAFRIAMKDSKEALRLVNKALELTKGDESKLANRVRLRAKAALAALKPFVK